MFGILVSDLDGKLRAKINTRTNCYIAYIGLKKESLSFKPTTIENNRRPEFFTET